MIVAADNILLSEKARQKLKGQDARAELIMRIQTAWLFEWINDSDSRSVTWQTKLKKSEYIKDSLDVNATMISSGETPLMQAAAHGKSEIIERLLELGASVFVKDEAGHSAICYNPQTAEAIWLLVSAGDDPTQRPRNATHYTLAQEAALKPTLDILDAYLACGINAKEEFALEALTPWLMSIPDYAQHTKNPTIHDLLFHMRDLMHNGWSITNRNLVVRIDTVERILNRLTRAEVAWERYCSETSDMPPTPDELIGFANIGKLHDAFSPAHWRWGEKTTTLLLSQLPPYLAEQVLIHAPNLCEHISPIPYNQPSLSARGR